MIQLFLQKQVVNSYRALGFALLLSGLVLPNMVSAANEFKVNRYHLGAGDKVEIKVFGTDDMSGEYTINGAGEISLPLIGNVFAQDLTVEELKIKLIGKLKPDYLLNPRVNIQVLNYRPFYILGEVEAPASYSYVDGMTYLNAVAIAGGFTYRAKKEYVLVIRRNDVKQNEIEIPIEAMVLPGDIIRIDERLF